MNADDEVDYSLLVYAQLDNIWCRYSRFLKAKQNKNGSGSSKTFQVCVLLAHASGPASNM
jgi:hypothetical protein